MKTTRPVIESVAWRLLVVTCIVWLLQPTGSVLADERDGTEKTSSIEGVVTYSGAVPKSKIRDNAGQQRELLTVGRRSRGLRDVLVYIEYAESNSPDLGDSEVPESTTISRSVVVDQIEHTFQPHLVAIRNGQKVTFTNSDVANHNVRSIAFEANNQFNVFTGAGGEYIHRFVTEKKLRPVRLSCDIHPWMRGWIFVFDHPYFAVTDEHGKFRIPAVPPGTYQLVMRQPDVDYRRVTSVDVNVGSTTSVVIEVTSGELKID